MTRCLLALGGNVGDVPAAFRAALRRLVGPDLRVVAVSRLFATPPMGADAGGTFLNAAAAVETALGPVAVLDRLLAAEDALGRVRGVRWGPRPIDLDLVFYGDRVLDLPRLRVPHPGCWYRRFVLDPLADVAPDVAHPETGETVARLRDRLLARPFPVAVRGPDETAREVAEALRQEFPAIAVVPPADSDAALTLALGADGSSAVARTVGVPDDAGRLDAARAVLTAALGVPDPVGGFGP